MFNFKARTFREPLRRLAVRSPSFGVAQFILLTISAATIYPGGYDFYSQYFSELGATMARNGEINVVSSSLFLVALIVMALTLVPFWLGIPSLFRDTRGMKAACILGSALGLMSTPFLIVIALCPIDTKLDMHFRMFMVFFPLFNVASLVYSIVIMLDRRIDEENGVLGLLLFALSILVIINPLASYVAFLQKVILYGYFIWVLMLNGLVIRKRAASP